MRLTLDAIRRNYALCILIAIGALASTSNLWSSYNGTFKRYVLCVEPCIRVDFDTGVIVHSVFLLAGFGLAFPIFGFSKPIATLVVIFLGISGSILLVEIIIHDPIVTVIRYHDFYDILFPLALLIIRIARPQAFWAIGFR
jgi:hypothetical protein